MSGLNWQKNKTKEKQIFGKRNSYLEANFLFAWRCKCKFVAWFTRFYLSIFVKCARYLWPKPIDYKAHPCDRTSESLIDVCITNSPERIVNSDVIPLGISDHSLVFMTRKIHYVNRSSQRIICKRSFKNFNESSFLNDLNSKDWENVEQLSDPNEMWDVLKTLFMDCLDKHAPLRHKRIGKKQSPWISSDLLSKMRQRDFLKKKAEQKGDPVSWTAFKKARNSVNAAIKVAKRDYFINNLEKSKGNMRKTWQLINELGSRNQKSTDIQELKVQGSSISTPNELAETFNSYFSGIGENLARDIPHVDIAPEDYVERTDKNFSLSQIGKTEVHKLINHLENNKATGLDKIPCKLLKLAVDIISPSLTCIFNRSIESGVFPGEWKSARVTPIFKRV